MTTGKKILVAGGIVVGVYVIYSLFKSSSATSSRNNGTAQVNSITGLVTAAGNAFASLASLAGSGTGVGGGGSYVAPNASTLQGIDPNTGITYSTEGIDPTTGGVTLAPGDTYGPPAPSSGLVAGGGDSTNYSDVSFA